MRFGILEDGAYGVSQSQKRVYIWAASAEETLPEWPEPMHVFPVPELRITLSENMRYAAVRSPATGAPFQGITVEDTIADLPAIRNGAFITDLEVFKISKITASFCFTGNTDCSQPNSHPRAFHLLFVVYSINLTQSRGSRRRFVGTWRS